MKKSYKEFLITAEPLNVEIISSVLWTLNIEGISEEINCIKVFTHDETINEESIRSLLTELKKNNLIQNFDIQENTFYEKNWNEEWEKSREVIKVSERIIIRPSFKEYAPNENEIIVTLDPKMSFGTGEHATTKICIKFLEQYLKPDFRVLDAGSGTAILSIVAAKLGASKVIAFDIDEWSLLNGTENIKLNQVENVVDVRMCELKDVMENDFDLIVANIQRNVLTELAEGLINKLKNNGIIILSGLLESDRQTIYNKYSSLGLKEIDFYQIDEWIGIVFRK
ncbi:MAG: 50S ribosomal protein L11 methyltransferase [Ignavibacterium album]|uniref:50S ribosomal protein L11 methyltransferase n=1 Tax=Ignavibacterium album TaxID=591197 RepID=UPI0026EBFD76|nr:50S ribosomal protein L11 methyltransferase [Ignavibacterium album]MCX8104883.1 50S ribosomal protein L11 methyltransferase [Ignavibacterium album]